MECIVDEDQATYGRFCVVDKDALTTQRISLVPLITAGTSAVYVNSRVGRFGTSTTNNTELVRNGTAVLTLDGTDVISATTLRSDTTNTDDLGSSSVGWREIFTRSIDTDGANNLSIQRNNTTIISVTSTGINVTGAVNATGDIVSETNLGGANFSGTTYTPTLTSVTNIASVTTFNAQYMRVGSTVTVSIFTQIGATLAAPTSSQLDISLPIASNFTLSEQCTGCGVGINSTNVESCYIVAETANNRASFIFIATNTTSHNFGITFSYIIV
jgi:hypothetical protein